MSKISNYNTNLQDASSIWDNFFPITVGAIGLFTMAFIGYALQAGHVSLLTVSKFELVNFMFTMQLYVLPLSFIGFAIGTSFYISFNVQANNGTINETFWKLLPMVFLFSFGIPHYFSGGILSVIVSSLLGWALLIYFLLDVIVFGAGAMVLAGSI